MRIHFRPAAWPAVALVAGLTLIACVTDGAAQSERPAILPIDTQVKNGEGVDKWLRPVRVSLVGASTEVQRAYVARQVKLFSAIIKHDVAMAEGSQGDILLVFGKEMPETALAQHADVLAPLYSSDAAMALDLRNDETRERCIAKLGMSAENPHEIAYAAGLVPTELNQMEFEQCAVRQLLTALGSKISAIDPIKSPANPGKHDNYTSILEVLHLIVLYDPRVEPGMTEEEVEPIMSATIQQMLPQLMME